MNPLKKLAGQTAFYGLPSIVGRILNYLLVPLHTNLFPQSDYGIQSYYFSLIAFFAVVFTYGMETAFFRYVSTSDNKRRTYSTAQGALFLTTLPALLCIILLAPQIASLAGYAEHGQFIVWFGLILSFDALCAIPFARLRIENRPIKFASIKIINILINISFNLIFLVLFPYLYSNHLETFPLIETLYNPEWTFQYVFLANLIASGITFLILSPYSLNLKGGFDKKEWKQMLLYAFPLLFLGMAGIVNETFDRILLKYLLPADIAEAQIGIYSACYKISILMTIFIQAYKYAAEPFFFLQAKEKDSKKTFADAMKFFMIAVSFIFLVTTVFLDVALVLIGKDFREGREVIPILLLANLFLGIFYNLSVWYKLTNKTKYGAYIAIFGAVITLAMNWVLIPILGYVGSAWATFGCYFLMMLVSFVLGQKYYPIPYNMKRMGIYFVLALLLFGIDYFVQIPSQFVGYAFKGILVCIFLIVVWKLEFPNLLRKKISS